jgi:DNA-binding Xre family transcriptional regulator
MIRFRLSEVLEARGWTAYRLAQETGLTVPTVYRLANPRQDFGRFTSDTLDRLCSALSVQPGDLLEWVASDRSGARPRRARSRKTPGASKKGT